MKNNAYTPTRTRVPKLLQKKPINTF